MKRNRRSALATVLVMTLGAWLAHAQTAPGGSRRGPAAPPAGGAGTTIATVAGRPVTREELSAREAQAFQQYKARVGQDMPAQVRPVMRRQLLENLIRRELLVLEAKRRAIAVSDDEAEAQIMQESFFNPNGQFDPRRFQTVKASQPENFRRAMESAREQIAARKLNDKLDKDYSPQESELRARVRRDLSSADVDYLALKRNEFAGSYREPREAEVLAAYRAGGEAYRRPAEAHLTALQVDQPPLPDGETLESPAGQKWLTGMRARADSAMAAARGGASFEDLARVCGSIRHDVTVTPDNFPGFWRGTPRENAAIFSARQGALLAAPIASDHGWMVVRVDQRRPAGKRPLAEVARQIRGELRAEARLHGEERILRAMFEKERGKFATTAWKLRYAVFDTASVPVPTPGNAELDRWHRAHQADFSTFDPRTGSIRVTPLSEVREAVTTMWTSEQRVQGMRIVSSQLRDAWSKGKRDRSLEKAAKEVRERGPLVPGSPVDSTEEGKLLAGVLAKEGWKLGDGMFDTGGGRIVYQVYDSVAHFEPPFEQVEPQLAGERAAQVREEDLKGARALYDADPSRFALRNVIYYSRLVLPTPNPLTIPLTHEQVEQYYHDHIDRYSAAEQVRVRQIMISPTAKTPEADAAAKAKADSLHARLVRGEDFATLARKYSDDVATRDQGGDLGTFGRGTMLAQFEKVAFGLKPGDLSPVFRTSVGYHIVRGVSYEPLESQPLRYVYANVGWDAAMEKSDSIMVGRCDSLLAAVHSPAEARAAGLKLGLLPGTMFHAVGDRRGTPEFNSFQVRLENTRPGHLVPGRGFDRSAGHFIAWVDSVAPARQQAWDQAKNEAMDVYRHGASQRALDAKRAELDSLMASGWSADSIATLYGGWEQASNLSPGTGLRGLGGSVVTDSVVFGTDHSGPVLKKGQRSDWLPLPGGLVTLRLRDRRNADPSKIAAEVETESRIALEGKLADYFDRLRKRYPVRILDKELRETPLPPPPASRLH